LLNPSYNICRSRCMYGLSKIEPSHFDFKHPYESTRPRSVGLCPQPIDNAYSSQGVQFLHTSTDIHSSFISTRASSDWRIPYNMKGRAKPSQKNNQRLLWKEVVLLHELQPLRILSWPLGPGRLCLKHHLLFYFFIPPK